MHHFKVDFWENPGCHYYVPGDISVCHKASERVLLERTTADVHVSPSRHVPNTACFSESVSDGKAILAVRGNT